MRRGLLGVRLCDRAPCPERWPCPTHGTFAVGDYEHLGRHAGAFELDMYIDVLDVASCGVCGYALCCCPAAEEPSPERPVCCICGHDKGLVAIAHGTDWACADIVPCCARAGGAAVEATKLDASALRPGWTTDGEGYFNDAIALMVVPEGEKWRVYGNGDPWPQGYKRDSQWVLAELAMLWAEAHAQSCARRAAEAYR